MNSAQDACQSSKPPADQGRGVNRQVVQDVFRRTLTSLERRFFRAPNSNVILALSMHGELSKSALRQGIAKVQRRHRLLQVTTRVDGAGETWFSCPPMGDIVVEEVKLDADQTWMDVALETHKKPFDFSTEAPLRLVIARDRNEFYLLLVCHHIICDGYSLIHIARDLLVSLARPHSELLVLPDPLPATRSNFRSGIEWREESSQTIESVNTAWQKQKVLFSDRDYLDMFRGFWNHHNFNGRNMEFSKQQTVRLLQRCKKERVTVNTGLLACLLRAQFEAQGDGANYLQRTGTAVSTRELMENPPGEAVGLYAAGAMFHFSYSPDRPFWQQARQLHQRIVQATAPDRILNQLARADQTDGALLDAVQFKRFGRYVDPGMQSHRRMGAFCGRPDVLAEMEKNKRREAKRGVILTNLSRVDIDNRYGDLRVGGMHFYPGTSEFFEKAVGSVTHDGVLTLVVSYVVECIKESVVDDFMAALAEVVHSEFD